MIRRTLKAAGARNGGRVRTGCLPGRRHNFRRSEEEAMIYEDDLIRLFPPPPRIPWVLFALISAIVLAGLLIGRMP